jgi:hypothetical protein
VKEHIKYLYDRINERTNKRMNAVYLKVQITYLLFPLSTAHSCQSLQSAMFGAKLGIRGNSEHFEALKYPKCLLPVVPSNTEVPVGE